MVVKIRIWDGVARLWAILSISVGGRSAGLIWVAPPISTAWGIRRDEGGLWISLWRFRISLRAWGS